MLVKYEVLKRFFGYSYFRNGQEKLLTPCFRCKTLSVLCRPAPVNHCVTKSRQLCCYLAVDLANERSSQHICSAGSKRDLS